MALHFLPPCTPELQPVEPFRPLVREAVTNRSIGGSAGAGQPARIRKEAGKPGRRVGPERGNLGPARAAIRSLGGPDPGMLVGMAEVTRPFRRASARWRATS